jgi:predicted RNA-binding Zn-ribbon protein involved in translation (DUF1610 family)
MEDVITNFELASTRLLRICPTCGKFQDKAYELSREQATLAEPCPQCGFHFPTWERRPPVSRSSNQPVVTTATERRR